MPSYSIHIACANEFLKKNKISNPNLFMQGVLAVDMAIDKSKSHYSNTSDTSNLKNYLRNKVNIDRYLSENNVTSDFDKGYLFHLITDYRFYTEFLSDDFILNTTQEEFGKIIYHDYNSINEYIKNKYKVEYPDIIKKYDLDNHEEPLILKYDLLDDFIKQISMIDLDSYLIKK